MYRAERAYGGNNIYQRYRRYLQKIYCTVTQYTLAYRYARENGHFYEKLAHRAHERRSRRYCSEPRERRPTRAKRFTGVTWNYFRARSRARPLIGRIFTMIIGTAAGVIKERRTRYLPLPPSLGQKDFFTKRSGSADILIPLRFLA